MDDAEIVKQIDRLVDEEHRLERDHVGRGLSPDDQARLVEVQTQLDRCWDLLRRRRARRAAGLDPDSLETRPAEIVEGYQQ